MYDELSFWQPINIGHVLIMDNVKFCRFAVRFWHRGDDDHARTDQQQRVNGASRAHNDSSYTTKRTQNAS